MGVGNVLMLSFVLKFLSGTGKNAYDRFPHFLHCSKFCDEGETEKFSMSYLLLEVDLERRYFRHCYDYMFVGWLLKGFA